MYDFSPPVDTSIVLLFPVIQMNIYLFSLSAFEIMYDISLSKIPHIVDYILLFHLLVTCVAFFWPLTPFSSHTEAQQLWPYLSLH